ncbi:MAG: hypothetical protein WC054_02050 [Candidatus Nanopelagicales bacterium]
MVNIRRRQLVNRRATAALFASMIACLLLAATPLWYFTGGASGLIFFVFAGLAIFVPLGSDWFSDRIVLAATGARVVEYADSPQIFDAVDGVRIAAGLPMPGLRSSMTRNQMRSRPDVLRSMPLLRSPPGGSTR